MKKRSDLPVWWLIVTFSLIYSFWSVNRHNRFQTDAVDLAIFDQPLWHYSRFEVPLSTVKYNQSPGEHILGDHFHPVLALLASLYWIWDDVRVMLVAQSILSVLSAWPIYKIAQNKFGHQLFSLSLAFAYLSFIGLQTAIDYDFHETTIAILPFSFALYFLVERQDKLFALSIFLTAFMKEDMPLFLVMLGFFAMIELRRFKLGLATSLFGALTYFLVTQWLIPFFKHDRFAYEELDPRLGRTTIDLLRVALFSPLLVLRTFFVPALKAKTILNLLASFAFLPLLSPLSLTMALPNLASRFLTRLSQRWLIRFQYNVILTPILAISVILGLGNLKKLRVFDQRFGFLLNLTAILLIVAPIIQTYRTNGPLVRMLNPDLYKPEVRFALNYELLHSIPLHRDVSVMAQSSFVPHLSHREEIYRFEDNLIDKRQPDYVLMSADEASDPPYVRQDLEAKIEILRQNRNYEVLFWDGVRLLMRKRADIG